MSIAAQRLQKKYNLTRDTIKVNKCSVVISHDCYLEPRNLGNWVNRGTKLSIVKISYENYTYRFWLDDERYTTAGNVKYINNVNVDIRSDHEQLVEQLEHEQDKIETAQERLEEINDMLEFMRDKGTTSLDTTEYAIYRILKTIKQNPEASDIEHGNMLRRLIKNF